MFSLIVGMLVSSSNTTVTTDSSTTLSCELYGYLNNNSIPTIIWTFDGNQLTDDSVFTITTEDGSHDHMIQNGGNTSRRSVRSVLTINRPRTTHKGTYVCSVDGDSRNITLQVTEGELQGIIRVPSRILSLREKLYECCLGGSGGVPPKKNLGFPVHQD